jgi:hypothetical protein
MKGPGFAKVANAGIGRLEVAVSLDGPSQAIKTAMADEVLAKRHRLIRRLFETIEATPSDAPRRVA